MRTPALAILVALLAAGCSAPEGLATVELPASGEHAECPPRASRGIAVPFRATAVNETPVREPGIHRVDARTFVWVWRVHESSLHEDRITRLNAVDVARDAEGRLHVCTRVDLSAPATVDREPRSYVVAARFEAGSDLPAGPVRFVVNWVAGCDCSPIPRGNTTAFFE